MNVAEDCKVLCPFFHRSAPDKCRIQCDFGTRGVSDIKFSDKRGFKGFLEANCYRLHPDCPIAKYNNAQWSD